jgi:hypothetical protein
MSLDSRIRTVLEREANALETPWPPPLDDLLAGGVDQMRRRRRRRVRVTAAVGLVLAAVTTASALLGGPSDRPRADTPVVGTPGQWLRDLPVGSPPRVLYCMDGVVRWGDDEMPMSNGTCDWPHRLAQVGDVAMAVDGAEVALFDEEGVHPVPVRADSTSSPGVISPDGRLAALVLLERVDGRQVIVLWDTVSRAEWKRVVAPTPDKLNLEGIDASGRVYMTSVRQHTYAPADRIWVWPSAERDGSFRRVTGVGDFVTLADVPSRGLEVAVLETLDDVEPEGVVVWGTVDDDGTFTLEAAGEARSAFWSPDRSRYLSVSESPSAIEVFSDEGYSVAELGIPAGVEVVEDPSWESNEKVLVPVASAPDALDVFVLRCGVGTGRCAVAAEGSPDTKLATDDVLSGPL